MARSKIIFQSRKAARMELLDQAASVQEYEQLYEESLWCLYALQDDVMQRENPYHEEDKKTIVMCRRLADPAFSSQG